MSTPKILVIGQYAELLPKNPTSTFTNVVTSSLTSTSSLSIGTTTSTSLSLITNNTPRIVIPGTGIITNSTSSTVLTLNGTTLSSGSIAETTTSGIAVSNFTSTLTITLSSFGNLVRAKIIISGTTTSDAPIAVSASAVIPASLRPPSDTLIIGINGHRILIRSASGDIEFNDSTNGANSGLFEGDPFIINGQVFEWFNA